MYFYSDTEVKTDFRGFKTPPDSNKMWLRHYANYIELSWMGAQPSLSHMERRQVEKELRICQKKLDYWYRKDDWSVKNCQSEIDRLKGLWKYEPRFPHG
jgi:hypothetical protein